MRRNLSGKKFGRLTAIKRIEDKIYGKRKFIQWLCVCDCDNHTEISVLADSLVSGNTTSCGCYQLEIQKRKDNKNIKHGLSRSRIYNIYYKMIYRCNNSKDYFDRGISICEHWENKIDGFENFYLWSINNGYSKNLSIDRIDNNGNYCPENCRWTTMKTQENNRRDNIFIEHDGITKTISQWAEYYDIPASTVFYRLYHGYFDFEDLFKKTRIK